MQLLSSAEALRGLRTMHNITDFKSNSQFLKTADLLAIVRCTEQRDQSTYPATWCHLTVICHLHVRATIPKREQPIRTSWSL